MSKQDVSVGAAAACAAFLVTLGMWLHSHGSGRDAGGPTDVTPEVTFELKPIGLEEITTVEAADAAVLLSAERPVFVFKHSTACAISGRAAEQVSLYVAEMSEMEANEGSGGTPTVVWLDVLRLRRVSDYSQGGLIRA